MIGVFGGTFDPVHYGHLLPVLEAARALALTEVRFIPSAFPPHRPPPTAAAAHRRHMLALALAERPEYAAAGFGVDDREIVRAGPSYTVITLASLRAEHADQPLVLLLGLDSFLGLPTWHRWRELPELAHLAVLARPGWTLGAMPSWAAGRLAPGPRALREQPAGLIWFQEVTPCDISATRIRERLARGESVAGLLPEAVRDYIESHQLYREIQH